VENINGALAFEATLNIDDFNVSSQAMERSIKHVSDTTIAESQAMDESLLQFAQRGAMYIQSYLVGQGMVSLINSIIQVRGQFQQLEIAFGTMLGSEEKATALMNQMVQTAAKTPFDLMGVASGAKQLLAYGEAADRVNDTLVRLGNIASGLSIPLNDIVYLYGTTMVQGRLYANDVRQFTGRGIPLVKELAAMYGVTAEEINAMVSAGKIGFPEVEKVIRKLTDEGGQFYNLMAKQSASLTGQISNLEDAWDSMLNDIGTANQDFFSDAIDAASYLVEHYQTIIDILKAVAIGYGTVKAATVLNTLATKGYTGVALIDNTVRAAKLNLLKAEATLTGTAKAQQDLMNQAQREHVTALEAELTAEEHANLVKSLRVATIQSLLTAQQAEYLSNLGLTASSEGYEAAAMQVLTVEQREALSKTDLTSKSAVYRAALEQEVAAKRQNEAATLSAMRSEVSAAARRVEAAKAQAVATAHATEQARYEVYWAKQSGDATAIATAQKKLEAAVENQAAARKAALSAQTDFYSKKKALETAAVTRNTTAHAANTAAETVQATATNFLSAAATKASLAMKALWASMMSNPIGWITTAIGAVISVLTLFGSKEEETETVMGEFQDTTQKEIDRLNTLRAIIETTTSTSKAHKDALEKINEICKQYNSTLMEENDTLDDQKQKYDELKAKIQETTAEKIKAKYAEQAMKDATEDNAESLQKLKDAAEDAQYVMQEGFYDPQSDIYTPPMMAAAENIRNASGAVWEAVEAEVSEKAADLAKKSGDEYNKALEDALEDIKTMVQASTGATEKEMDGMSVYLRRYVEQITDHTRTANNELDKIDRQLKGFFSSKPDTSNVTESVISTKMTFEELEEKLKDTQKQIDTINAKQVKVDADTTELERLKNLLDQINGAISGKQAGLNTENGINARIKQLKEERANVDITSQKYKDLTNQIQTLQKRLPKTTTGGGGGGKSGNSANSYAEKELAAQRKLEEARIDVMEEGYARRKAILDLQHKKELDEINKEERELADARKKAGRGTLTAEQTASFAERRKLADEAYYKESSRLFDGEIDYKKRQYQAYFKWVENVGKDVADKHFKTLIAEGTSFTSWINSQIQTLEQKKAAGTLTDGDANALNALKIQLQEMTGEKSALELFKESLRQSTNQAATLAEKLEAVAAAQAKLNNGEFHLNEDDTTQAQAMLNEQDLEYQRQLQDEVLKNYRTFEEQRTSIQKQYAELRRVAQAMNDTERVAQINRAEQDALSELNAQMLMQSQSWKRLFQDLDSLTVAQIQQLIKDIQNQVNSANLKLNPVDMNAVLESLDKAKQKIQEKNPFKALGQYFDDYIAAKKKLAEEKAKLAAGNGSKDEVDKAQMEVKQAAKGVTQSIQTVTSVATQTAGSLQSVFSALGMDDAAEGLGTAIELMGTLGEAAGSVGKIMSGDVLGGVMGLIGAASSLVGIFAKLHDKKYENRIQSLQKEIDALDRQFSRLERAFNNTYWVFSDEQRKAYEQNVKLINDQITALEAQRQIAKKAWNYVEYAKLSQEIENLNTQLKAKQEEGDLFTLYEQQIANLRQQQEKIYRQIDAERDKKDTDEGRISDWEDKIEDINQKCEDLERQMHEMLAGTSVQSAIETFADALVDAFQQGEDAAKALGETTKNILKKAVLEAIKRQFLAKGINDAINYLSEAMGDNVLTDDERATFEDMANTAGETFHTALSAMGDLLEDVNDDVDPLSGAIASMSEETGSVIAGRLNAFIINQSQQTSILRDSLTYQAQIAQNTGKTVTELEEIKRDLREIKNGNSLLSQGIS